MCKSVAQKGLRSRLGIDKNAGMATTALFREIFGLKAEKSESKNPEGSTLLQLKKRCNSPVLEMISGRLILNRPDI
ncbi:hypothetical protein LAB1_04350 [Roseibium sp. LAB1]